MTASAWIALASLLITLLTGLIIAVFRAAVLLTNVRRDSSEVKRDISSIKKDLKDLRENHVDHIENDIRAIKEKLWP